MSNRIRNVAIVGAGGNIGRMITTALLATGVHRVTAITRYDSQTKLSDGIAVKKVDYDKHESLVEALQGQEALVITLSGHAAFVDIQTKLARAAAEARVGWIMPSEWAPDTANESIVKDVFLFQMQVASRKAIEDVGNISYIALSTGFWYEYMLAMPPTFGFDFAQRNITFFDDGRTPVSFSTMPQVGRAVAGILSLPIQSEGSDKKACLEAMRNKVVYVNSFTISQQDIFESTLRVTATKKSDWTVTNEPSHDRYAAGVRDWQEKKRIGLAKIMATRVFYPDGSGDFEHNKGTLNNVLGLAKEDVDEMTKIAIDRSQNPSWVEGG